MPKVRHLGHGDHALMSSDIRKHVKFLLFCTLCAPHGALINDVSFRQNVTRDEQARHPIQLRSLVWSTRRGSTPFPRGLQFKEIVFPLHA